MSPRRHYRDGKQFDFRNGRFEYQNLLRGIGEWAIDRHQSQLR